MRVERQPDQGLRVIRHVHTVGRSCPGRPPYLAVPWAAFPNRFPVCRFASLMPAKRDRRGSGSWGTRVMSSPPASIWMSTASPSSMCTSARDVRWNSDGQAVAPATHTRAHDRTPTGRIYNESTSRHRLWVQTRHSWKCAGPDLRLGALVRHLTVRSTSWQLDVKFLTDGARHA